MIVIVQHSCDYLEEEKGGFDSEGGGTNKSPFPQRYLVQQTLLHGWIIRVIVQDVLSKFLWRKRHESIRGFLSSLAGRCRANMALIRQSRPEYGPGVQVQVTETVEGVPCSTGSCQTTVIAHNLCETANIVLTILWEGWLSKTNQ